MQKIEALHKKWWVLSHSSYAESDYVTQISGKCLWNWIVRTCMSWWLAGSTATRNMGVTICLISAKEGQAKVSLSVAVFKTWSASPPIPTTLPAGTFSSGKRSLPISKYRCSTLIFVTCSSAFRSLRVRVKLKSSGVYWKNKRELTTFSLL